MNIRIIDIRKPESDDMETDAAAEVDYIRTDITSAAAVDAAFKKPWDRSISHLPLTIFHTAAVILASDGSKYLFGFPKAVIINGTKNVLATAEPAGADIFSSTSSARRVIGYVVRVLMIGRSLSWMGSRAKRSRDSRFVAA